MGGARGVADDATASLVEAEPEMARAGRMLARRGPDALQRAVWAEGDAVASNPEADLVVVSYVLGELPEGRLVELVRTPGNAPPTRS